MMNRIRVFVPALMAAALVLPVSAQVSTPKGAYVLAEEGTASNGAFASLANLNFADGGVLSGTMITRNASGVQQAAFQGSFTMDSANAGTMRLNTTINDEDGNPQTRITTYRFVVGTTQIQAIRTGAGIYSSASIFPSATAGGTGNFVFSESINGQPLARVVSLTLDTTGAISGSSIEDALGKINVQPISGNLTAGENGFSTLTLMSSTTNDDGDTSTVKQDYAVAFAKDRAVILRLEGPVSLNYLTR